MMHRLSISILLILASFSAFSSQSAEEKALDSFVYLTEGAFMKEYRNARHVFRFKKGAAEFLAALTSYENIGGNSKEVYLAVFDEECEGDLNEKHVCNNDYRYRLNVSAKVGDTGDLVKQVRVIDTSNFKYQDGKIYLKAFYFKDDDARCCPSVEKEIVFSFKEAKLIEE